MRNKLTNTFLAIVFTAGITGCKNQNTNTPLTGEWDTKVTDTSDATLYEGKAFSIWTNNDSHTHLMTEDGHRIVYPGQTLDTVRVETPEIKTP